MDHFWLTDEQFATIAPLLSSDTRGRERVDDRRVINGIVRALKSGGRWADASRDLYGSKKILYNCFVRRAAKVVWVGLFENLAQAGGPPSQVLIDSTAVKAYRCAAGGQGGGTEPSRPSSARLAHDQDPRPHRSLLPLPPDRLPADRWAGFRLPCRRQLLKRMPAWRIVLAGKGYDSYAILWQIGAAGAAPNIPPKTNCRRKLCFPPMLYRGRNAIERVFGHLKDFRCIAIRYDCLATNYLAAVCLAGTISCWL